MESRVQTCVEQLKKNTIKRLCLTQGSFNVNERDKIDVEVAECLSNALINNTSLLSLDLSWNGIGDRGAECIARALLKNKTLLKLNLRGNQIGDKGAECLSNALSNNNSLISLDLSSNGNVLHGFGTKGFEHLARTLLKNTTLQTFDLRSYRFRDRAQSQGALFLCQAIQKNPSLKDIQGIFLAPKIKNKITLLTWRLEIESRRKKVQEVLEYFVQDVNLIRAILQMESCFPWMNRNRKTRKNKKRKIN